MRLNVMRSLLLLPLPGEGWDGGTHDAGNRSALAPTLTLPREGKGIGSFLPREGRE